MRSISKMLKTASLQKKIMLAVCTIVIVIVLAMSAFIQFSLYRNMSHETVLVNQHRLEMINKNCSAVINQIVEDVIDITTAIQKRVVATKGLLGNRGSFSVLLSGYYPKLIKSVDSFAYIHSMMVFTKDGDFYSYSNECHEDLQEDLFAKTMEMVDDHKIITWSDALDLDYYFDTDLSQKIISVISQIKVNYQTEAVFVVNIKVDELERLLGKSKGNDSLVLQLGEGYEILMSLNGEEQIPTDAIKNMMGYCKKPGMEETDKYYLFTDKVPATGWLITLLYSKYQMRKNTFDRFSGVLFLVIIFTIGMVLLSMYVVRNVTKPINQVTKDIIHAMETGELTRISFVPKTNDEISSMIYYYNNLIESIKEDREKIEQEQTLRNAMYLQMLQMQINPHFLYNTLEALKCLIMMKDDSAEEMVSAIGDFYKGSLIETDDITTMEEEIHHIESYLIIMKLRYRKKLDYEIQMDKSLAANVAVKLSLQPIIENAITHGIQRKRGVGKVMISVYRAEGIVIAEIFDSGEGIAQERLAELKTALNTGQFDENVNHIGLVNVHRRIRLRFGSRYGIEIDSKEGLYTKVQMKLPLENYHEK